MSATFVVDVLLAAVEKEQQEYQRNRRLSAVDLSRGALKPGGLKEKVTYYQRYFDLLHRPIASDPS